MNNLMKLRFDDAAINDIEDINPSFAKGSLWVMYTGQNPNGTDFSKEVIENALPTIKNIPIVAHYDKEENEIGSHDVEIVADKEGNFRIRNLTEPCGVVPESATAEFRTKTDYAGIQHEYLVIEPVILWKRQEVYNHIIDDLGGKVDHSMEINVTAYHKEKGSKVLTVDNFEFQALCLLESAAPCFSGSELELYAATNFKTKMAEMMAEFKETFSLNTDSINALNKEIDIEKNVYTKGGDEKLEDKLALITKYGLKAEDLDFSIDEYSVEELEEKLKEMKFDDEPTDNTPEEETPPEDTGSDGSANEDPSEEPSDDPAQEDEDNQSEGEQEEDTDESIEGNQRARRSNFELSELTNTVLRQALYVGGGEIEYPWGKEPRYWMQEYDEAAGMVYAMDGVDRNVYGFAYTKVGDNVAINWDSKKRMKIAYVEFNEGDNQAMSETFSHFDNKYQETISELVEFKLGIEREAANVARKEVLDKFSDLGEYDVFNDLVDHASDYSPEDLEEKCYALRGKLGVVMKFSRDENTPKIKIVKEEFSKEPYGGLFVQYGIGNN